MLTLTIDQFNDLSMRMFKAGGATDEEAAFITESLLWATLRGHDSHGLGHMALYTRNFSAQIGSGGIKLCGPFAPYRIIREAPATVAIDANGGMGQKVTLEATLMVIEKAKKTGIAAATITNGLHNGANGYYVSRIVEHGMIGIACTGAGAASPPLGGLERMLGTNPIAFGIPANEEQPIIIDMTTSSSSWAGLRPYMAAGQLPPGLVLDSEGEPTTNPADFSYGSSGNMGFLDNMAGTHKGYALQLAVEMIGSIFPGLMTGNEVAGGGKLNNPALIMAINIAFFQDVDAFKAKVDARIREIKGSKKKKGVEEILLPGERGARTMEKRLKDGIPVHEAYWEEIEVAAQHLGVDLGDFVGAASRG